MTLTTTPRGVDPDWGYCQIVKSSSVMIVAV
jgi:hypothetical protein